MPPRNARVNNTGTTGEQQVTWGMDRDGDGRIDDRDDDDDSKIDWSKDGKAGSERSYGW